MVQLQSRPRTGAALARIVQGIEDISTLPHVAMQIVKIAGDPRSGASNLKQAMESDLALSARVFKYVNSSAYALKSKITNLQHAIAYLGMKQIRNLALMAGVSDLFRSEEKIGPYCRSQLWRHSVAVGLCSRMIAKRLKLDEPEDLFLAGLLHDVGIVLEDQHVHEDFSKILQSLQKDKTLAEVERNQLGFDHTLLGEQVGALWGLPEPVLTAIRYHHMSVNYRGDYADVVRCVEVANLICTLKGISSVGLNLVRISRPALAGLSLTGDDTVVLVQELDAELEANAELFIT